jgi:hypothetical protein
MRTWVAAVMAAVMVGGTVATAEAGIMAAMAVGTVATAEAGIRAGIMAAMTAGFILVLLRYVGILIQDILCLATRNEIEQLIRGEQ